MYEHGGIYLDTDVEALKSFDGILEKSSFFGFENKNSVQEPGHCQSRRKGNESYIQQKIRVYNFYQMDYKCFSQKTYGTDNTELDKLCA